MVYEEENRACSLAYLVFEILLPIGTRATRPLTISKFHPSVDLCTFAPYINVKNPQMELHLAQLNIARMLAPIDSPVMADFVAKPGYHKPTRRKQQWICMAP